MNFVNVPLEEKLQALGLTDEKINDMYKKYLENKIEKEKEKKHEMIFDRLVFWIEEMTEDHHTLELLDKERLFIYRFSYKYDKFHQFDDNSFQQYIINKDKENSEYDLLYLLLTC